MADSQQPTPAERRASMAVFCSCTTGIHAFHGNTWAQRLKRVFGIDIDICPACGGAVQIIAYIEDPVVIKRIPSVRLNYCSTLTHTCDLDRRGSTTLDLTFKRIEKSPWRAVIR
jgi:hypothetical protein